MNWKLLLIALTLILGISARPADEHVQEASTQKVVAEVTNLTERPPILTESPIEIIKPTKKITTKIAEKVSTSESTSTVQIPTTTSAAPTATSTIRYLASQSLQIKRTNAKRKYANNYANLITKYSLNNQNLNNKMPNITVDNNHKSNSNNEININYVVSSDSHASINNNAFSNKNNFNEIVTTNKNSNNNEEQSIPIATISSPTTSNSSSKPLVFVDADVTFSHFSDLSTTRRAFIHVNGNSQPGSWSNYNLEDTSEQTLTTRKKPVIHKIISKWSDNPNDVFNLHAHDPIIIPTQEAQLNELKNQIAQSAHKQQLQYQSSHSHSEEFPPNVPLFPPKPPIFPPNPPVFPPKPPVIPPNPPVFPPPLPPPIFPPNPPPVFPPPPPINKPHISVTSFDNLPTLIGQQLIHHQQHINALKPTLALQPTVNNLLLLNKPNNLNALKDYCKNIKNKLGNKLSHNIDNIEQCKGLNIFINNKVDNTISQATTTDYDFPINDKFEDPPSDILYDNLAHQIETEPDSGDLPTALTQPETTKGTKNKNKKKKGGGGATDVGSMVMTVMTMMAIFNPLNFGVWGIILAPVAAITLGGACFMMYQIMTHQHKEKPVWHPQPWPKPQEIIIRNKIKHSAIPIRITHLHKQQPQRVIYAHHQSAAPPQIHNMPIMEYSPPWSSAPEKQPVKSYGEPPVDSYHPSAPQGGPYRRKTSMSKHKNRRPNPFKYKLL